MLAGRTGRGRLRVSTVATRSEPGTSDLHRSEERKGAAANRGPPFQGVNRTYSSV